MSCLWSLACTERSSRPTIRSARSTRVKNLYATVMNDVFPYRLSGRTAGDCVISQTRFYRYVRSNVKHSPGYFFLVDPRTFPRGRTVASIMKS